MEFEKIKPICPVFGICGGCQYQDMRYSDELILKHRRLQTSITELDSHLTVEPVVASPDEYHYRSRLDLKFVKTRDGRYLLGFSPLARGPMVEVNQCPIAIKAVSDFLPQLKEEAIKKLLPKYKNANLVVKCDSDGNVRWGGIGRRSLRLPEDQYLYADLHGMRFFFSLDTFFQANLSILPKVLATVPSWVPMTQHTEFFDLYGGVGLFGLAYASQVKRVVLVEENIYSTQVAQYTIRQRGLSNVAIVNARVEDVLHSLLTEGRSGQAVVMVDPPRQGLSPSVAFAIASEKKIAQLFYLSCHPESLVRDLKIFMAEGWKIIKIAPFDFFPRTQHLETLVLLQP